ncbi:Response regulator receiver domain protein [Rhizobium leguminosarum bv. trifolii WSM2297]|uniref:Response regulator receiver domain protein n=1 Tax=Rhizobium leguminosarum bv. trifolii WSM2297 TaxID=754762 RepID=J0WBV0_RHILT|nr:response regulator [Rhizobium leguminosarum]EJC83236.1 Response regulator receiver domain protein [Rhizobium leguminosarum bv. trifolii WSM2297]EJC85171.1 Response regulator receiver domain protein [Rhizobium leguminosarum bv. trifolii WSM2297]
MNVSGMKVLVVEDEGLVALMIEDMLEDLGFDVVASVSRLADARTIVADAAVDLAVLDVNLAGESSFSIAEILRKRQIPFIFSTGYGLSGLPDEFAHQPLIGKPFSKKDLQETIEAALKL